jgi:hypothetical protein
MTYGLTYSQMHPQVVALPKHRFKIRHVLLAGAIALGVAKAPAIFDTNKSSIDDAVKSTSVETAPIEVAVHKRYRPCYDRLEKLGASASERKMIAAVFYAETFHTHYDEKGRVRMGSHGDIGLAQLTRPAIEDVIWKVLDPKYRRLSPDAAHAYVINARTILPYLHDRGMQKDVSRFMTSHWARRRVINAMKKKVTESPEANLYFGAANILHRRAAVRTICRQEGVEYEAAMTNAAHNAPEATKRAIQRGEAQWERGIPSITKRHVKRFKKHFNGRIVGV